MTKKRVFSIHEREDVKSIVALRRAGAARWRLEEWLDLSGEETPPRSVARAMAGESQSVTWLLKNHDVQLNSASLPHLKHKETERAVAGWVAREEKGEPDQFFTAWRELRAGRKAGDAATRDMILMYARQDVVQPPLDAAAAWDVKPGRMLPAYMALDAFFRLAGPGTEESKVWNVVFVGRTTNFLCVASEDSLLMTRPLPGDLSGGQDPAEYADRLTTEVTRSQLFARQSAGSPEVERIIVCGDAQLAPMLVERLAGAQDTPVQHWDLATHFDVGDHAFTADGYLPLAAAALAGEPVGMNLLKEPRRGLLGAKAKRRILATSVALAVTITPLLWFAGTTITSIHETYLSDARLQLRRSQGEAREAEDVYKTYRRHMERRDLMNAHAACVHDLDRLLLELAGLTPARVTFRDLQIVEGEEGMMLSIIGESRADTAERAQQAFLDFKAALDASGFLIRRGEPRLLEIDRPEEQQTRVKRVVFSLDYGLAPSVEAREGRG